MTIGKNVKLLRIAAGLKQKDLAERLGVSPNYLSMVENDKREPSMSLLKDLSRELHIPLGLLFLDVEETTRRLTADERAIYFRIRNLLFEVQKLRMAHETSKRVETEEESHVTPADQT